MSVRWPELAFSELFENVTSSSRKLPRGDYLPAGRFPVVDQGEDFVGGWSDDEFLVHPGPIPVVVYGDHTRTVKLLERPFIQGADGVKVLAPRPAVSARFAAWMLRAFPVPSKGYARHYAALRKLVFPVPGLDEQHRIVAAIETHFSRLDAAVASLTRAKANVKRARASVLKAAVEGRLVPTEAALARAEGREYEPAAVLLDRILAERKAAWAASGARGKYAEPVKPETEGLPGLPEGWALSSLDELCSRITSGSRDWSKYYGRGNGVFILAQNVRRRRLDLSERQLVDPPAGDPASSRSAVRAGDLLVTIVGANTGDACRVPADLSDHFVCQSVALMRPVIPSLASFIEGWLDSKPLKEIWERFMYGQGRPHLGFDDLRRSPVMVPPLTEQHRIVAEVDRRLSVLDALDASVDANLARCARLRQSVLKRAFEGRLVPAEDTATAPPAASGPVR